MEFIDDLEIVRADYMSYYESSYIEIQKTYPENAKEVLLKLDSASRQLYSQLYRVDVLIKKNGKHSVAEMNFDRSSKFSNDSYRFNGLQIQLEPLVWNDIEIITDSTRFDQAKIGEWFGKWIDEEDNNPVDTLGYSSVIHSFSYKKSSRGYEYAIDFGSAPTSALTELLQIIEHSGASAIKMGSYSVQ